MDSLKKMFVLSHRDCLSHFIPKILENPITKGQIFDASGDKVLVDLGLFDGYIDLKETRLKDSDFHVGDFVEFKITRFELNSVKIKFILSKKNLLYSCPISSTISIPCFPYLLLS